MKDRMLVSAAVAAAFLCLAPLNCAQGASVQAFAGVTLNAGMEGALAESDSSGGGYAEGTRAIAEGRWADAAAIFSKLAGDRSEHADGALYWLAYAENKQGQGERALATCAELRAGYPASRWIQECGALEIEIRGRSGKPVRPQAGQDEDLRLLALNTMMRQDEPAALREIQRIVQENPSPQVREKVLFILAQGKSAQARALLAEISRPRAREPEGLPALPLIARSAAGPSGTPSSPYPETPPGSMTLDVVVEDKTGHPVTGLAAEDFTLLDNKQPRPLTGVRAAAGGGGAAEVFLVIDAINMRFLWRANQREWLNDFFAENGGRLALPTQIVLLTDNNIETQNRPTQDGKVLKAFLAAHASGFTEIRGYQGLEGDLLREENSLKALNLFAVQQSKRPGRKLFIWLGQGWGVTSNPSWFGGPRKMQNIYRYISALSTSLREARMTVYSVVPAAGVGREEGYVQYVKGVADPKHVDLGDLALPVLAVQTGGQVLVGSSDLAGLIDRCIADVRTSYEVTFTPPPAGGPDEYHAIEVAVGRPGLKARTRTGYYSAP